MAYTLKDDDDDDDDDDMYTHTYHEQFRVLRKGVWK
jgi:hypothetical protein